MNDKTNAMEKIITAKTKLMLASPFYGYILLRMKEYETNDIETMGVDVNGSLFFNPKFTNELEEEELHYVLLHEVIHVAFDHTTRLENMPGNSMLKNIALDLVTNYLIDNDIENIKNYCKNDPTAKQYFNERKFIVKPKGIQLDNMFHNIRIKDKSVEEVYEQLLKQNGSRNGEDSESRGSFDYHLKEKDAKNINGKDRFNNSSKNVYNKNKQTFKINRETLLNEALEYSRIKGEGSMGAELAYKLTNKVKVNWKAKLRKYLKDFIHNNYTYNKLSKRSCAVGSALPSLLFNKKIKIAVLVDTSGSTYNDISEFMSECNSSLKTFENTNVDLLCFDDGITDRHFNLKKIDYNIKISGGGGTDMKEAYNEILERNKKQKYDCMIIYTDGYLDYPNKYNRNIPTLWIMSKNWSKDYPLFGEVIKL